MRIPVELAREELKASAFSAQSPLPLAHVRQGYLEIAIVAFRAHPAFRTVNRFEPTRGDDHHNSCVRLVLRWTRTLYPPATGRSRTLPMRPSGNLTQSPIFIELALLSTSTWKGVRVTPGCSWLPRVGDLHHLPFFRLSRRCRTFQKSRYCRPRSWSRRATSCVPR